MSLVEVIATALKNRGARDGFLVAAASKALGFIQRAADRFQIGQGKLGIDGVDIANRIDRSFDMDDVAAFKAADDVQNRVNLADVRQKLVAQPFTRAGPAHDAGDIDDAHLRRG